MSTVPFKINPLSGNCMHLGCSLFCDECTEELKRGEEETWETRLRITEGRGINSLMRQFWLENCLIFSGDPNVWWFIRELACCNFARYKKLFRFCEKTTGRKDCSHCMPEDACVLEDLDLDDPDILMRCVLAALTLCRNEVCKIKTFDLYDIATTTSIEHKTSIASLTSRAIQLLTSRINSERTEAENGYANCLELIDVKELYTIACSLRTLLTKDTKTQEELKSMFNLSQERKERRTLGNGIDMMNFNLDNHKMSHTPLGRHLIKST